MRRELCGKTLGVSQIFLQYTKIQVKKKVTWWFWWPPNWRVLTAGPWFFHEQWWNSHRQPDIVIIVSFILVILFLSTKASGVFYTTTQPVLRIRDVYSGSGFFTSRIPGQKDSRIRIRIKELKYFNTKEFLSSRKWYDPGWYDLDFLPFRIPDPGVKKAPDPESRGQKSTGSRIRISNTANKTETYINKM